MIRIAITGALGFIGTEFATRLLKSNTYDVTLVDFWPKLIRQYETARFPILEHVYSNMAKAACTLEPSEFLQQISDRSRFHYDIIVHLGAVVDTTDILSDDMIAQNVAFVRELVKHVRTSGSTGPQIIFASSAAVYGSNMANPNNPYGLTKSMGEAMIAQNILKFSCLRFFNVFGEFEHHKGKMASIPFKLAQAYKAGDPFDMHSLDAKRDFVPVSNVVAAIEELISSSPSLDDRFLDVGTGTATSFSDLDMMICKASGQNQSIVRVKEMPSALNGRYQVYTRAGMTGTKIAKSNEKTLLTTDSGIKKYYGNKSSKTAR